MSHATNPKGKACLYCGHNPVPHFFNWYFESLNILLTPVRQRLLGIFFSRWLRTLANKINLPWLAARFFQTFGVLSRQPEMAQCKVKRARVLWEEAKKRGIKFWELKLFGRPFDTYLAARGEKKLVFSGLPRPRGYSQQALDVLDDKVILKRKFQRAGLPAPEGGAAYSFHQALKIFDAIAKPVIVKPRAGSRGRHSTTFVNTPEDFKQAFIVAKQLCYWVVVEEQLFGPVYRATVINFNLEGVLRGDPPQVAGDGAHSIAQLVELKNQKPHPGVSNIALDEQSRRFLFRQKLSELSVVPPGQIVSLSEKIGVSYGGSSSEDFLICHQDNRALFVAAARIMGDPLVGFDFIIPDISRSFKNQRCGFIEANSLPFINLHHDPLLGSPRNVAAKVWEMVGW